MILYLRGIKWPPLSVWSSKHGFAVDRSLYAKIGALKKDIKERQAVVMLEFTGTIYQPLRSGRIWHKVNF